MWGLPLGFRPLVGQNKVSEDVILRSGKLLDSISLLWHFNRPINSSRQIISRLTDKEITVSCSSSFIQTWYDRYDAEATFGVSGDTAGAAVSWEVKTSR